MSRDYVSDNKIKENKYKILRMSLLLGADENKEETLANFEDAAREIDAMNDDVYLRDINDKFYDTNKLEDEEKRLDVLVNFIDGRVEQRISLLTDFANVTGFDLQNLPAIKYYDKLDDYKDRLKYIREYLGNIKRLDILHKEVVDDNNQLDIAIKNKKASEEFNFRNEEILLNKFLQIVKRIDYFKDINEDSINDYLDKVMISVNDSKKSLDIFVNSFNTLLHSGIGSDEEAEYRSYVVSAQDVYYDNKEKEYLIRLYQYVHQKEKDYNSIVVKRDCIHDLLSERLGLRKELNISDNDVLESIYDLLEKQYQDILTQKDNIDRIDHLNSDISLKQDEINSLELDNQKVEILAILREFGIVDQYNDKGVVYEEEVSDDYLEDTLKEEDNKEVSNSSIFDFPIKDEKIDDIKEDSSLEKVENISDDIFLENKEDGHSEEDNDKIEEMDSLNHVEDVQEEVMDNQVVSVEEASSIDLDLVHSKANKVMQRVGEMLGIKVQEEEVVSVVDSSLKQESPKEDVAKEEVKENNVLENPLFSDGVIEDKKDEGIDESFWFPSDTPDALNELPDLDVKDQKMDSNNFFANNNSMPDLIFPDLKVDFGNEGEA